MQKLLFDLSCTQPSGSGKRHGGGRYGEIIFARIAARDLPVTCFYDSAKWLNPEMKELIDTKKYDLIDISNKPVEEIIHETAATRLYSALPDPSLLQLKDVDRVFTLHGLRQLERPLDPFFWKYKDTTSERLRHIVAWLLPGWWMNRQKSKYKEIFNSGAKIITVSNHTKFAIKSFFPELNLDLQVFFSPNTSSSTLVEKSGNEPKYFLLVSGNRWDKNNLRALIAFDRLASAGLMDGYRLKITGCSADNFSYRFKNLDKIDFYGYVDDQELEKLYANAFAFVYPSLNEGFGYPPLEAMRYGVPVLASPYSSISDVLKGSALYFNPMLIEEIMGRMLMMQDGGLHDEYALLGRKQYDIIKARQDSDLDGLIDFLYK
jgi:glycosyltransferase involved in cell wall biosynthesis